MSLTPSARLRFIVIALVALALLVVGIRVGCCCGRHSPIVPIPPIAPISSGSSPSVPIVEATTVFGPNKPVLTIKIPPHKDTLKITVNSDLKPAAFSLSPHGDTWRVGPCSLLVPLATAQLKTSLISWHPEFGLVGLVAARFDSAQFCPALKFAPLHIWRFDPGLYVSTIGPGAGVGFRAFSNLSLDAVYLMSPSTPTQWANPSSYKPRLAFGASLRF